MPLPETTKERASRIQLDYHTKPDFFECWKHRLGGIAVLVTLAGAGLYFVLAKEVNFAASRGQVASVHQAWDSQCSACHENFTPISSNSWQACFLPAAQTKVGTNRCENCHAGPVHHASQKPDLTCGSCHRDHQGKDFSLVNLPDTDCTRCHKDLGNHMDPAKAWHVNAKENEIHKNVIKFSKDTHPPFRSIAKDPGKLRFNHKRHLTPGMALEEDGKKGDGIKTLGSIPALYQDRYFNQQKKNDEERWKNENDGKKEKEKKKTELSDPVQLTCASCHQLDSGDFGMKGDTAQSFPFSIQGQRGAGAYMVPIVYDNQCIACHPLEHKLSADKTWVVPHRLLPSEIHGLLNEYYTAQIVRETPGFKEGKITRPLPFKLSPLEQSSLQKSVEKSERRLLDEIDWNNAKITREFFKGNQSCALCHYFEGPKGEQAANVPDRKTLKIVPTRVPQVWFQHAKFNHTSHRTMKCDSCHKKAETSEFSQDVLIPDKENCVQCHAPGKGARFNCTECHRYHNGDQPGQGIGAQQRNPTRVRSIDEFLRGVE